METDHIEFYYHGFLDRHVGIDLSETDVKSTLAETVFVT